MAESFSSRSARRDLGFALLEHVPLAPLTTFGIGGEARRFAPVSTEAELRNACVWAGEQRIPVFVLGGGSNVLVDDGGFSGLVLHIRLAGINEDDPGKHRRFRVAAGEDWDGFVSRAVAADCAGVECLAGIPGSVGGTPVQNVGAYGQEAAQTITRVRAYDRREQQFTQLDNNACGFAYRTSRFNTAPDQGRFIVTEVEFELTPGGSPMLSYADLRKRFPEGDFRPSLQEVAEAVRSIRRAKGMLIDAGPLDARDPDTRSAGSFFKNPVVNARQYAIIAASVAPTRVPSYPAPDAPEGLRHKLPAAWLLEQAGFTKGLARGGAALSSKHTLALTNRSGHATAAEMLALRDELVAGVWRRFGVMLEPEPVFVSG